MTGLPKGSRSVLITGGCGFVGINLVTSLASRCNRIRVFDDLSSGDLRALKREWSIRKSTTRLEFIRGDVRERQVVEDALRDVDAVVHLAAQPGVISSIENPSFDYSVNVLGTFNVLEAARNSEIRKVVFASSNAAAGKQTPPVSETVAPHPASPYGASKLAAEGYCSAYHEAFGIGTIVLRFANAYGPHSTHKTSVIARFLSLSLSGTPLTIYGDGSQTRDFVHVEDLCQAILLALAEEAPSGAYQIGTGVETSVNELISTIEQIVGRNLPRRHLPARHGEVVRTYLDISKARALLGYSPQFSLKEGLENTYRWFLNRVRTS